MMTERQILQLLVDALASILAGGDGYSQAALKVEQAQAALLEPACDGSKFCKAETHIQGCFAGGSE
jgi:hypothetical protein